MYTLKKSLGQHFLKDESVCHRIVEVLQQAPFQRLLEVGPGGGALTKYLIKLPAVDFKLVEIDTEKVAYLHSTYPQLKDKIIEASILDVEMPFSEPFTLIGNFPYNISTQIVFKVIEWREHIETMIGMFQKEVAERICSKKGSKVYGILSVLAQAFYDVEYLFTVEPEVFNPPPKVKSGVMRMKRKENYSLPCDEKLFFTVVKTAFQQRRKTLRNSLKSFALSDNLKEDTIFDLRPEQLSVEQFIELTQKIAANAV